MGFKGKAMPKLLWFIQFISPKGGKAYVKQKGKLFEFVTVHAQATGFKTKPEADAYAEEVRKVNRWPERITVVGAAE